MKCSPPRPTIEEAVFGMYINNLYCAAKGLFPFMQENKEEKRKKLLNDFSCSIKRISGNKKALIVEGKYVSLDENERRLQHLCDEIVDILFHRRKDLKEMRTKGDSDYLLFLDQIFDFFLYEKNLPNFINLIFSLITGGSIFTKEGDCETDRKWLDSFELKI